MAIRLARLKRLSLNLGLRQVAREIGVDPGGLSRFERGERGLLTPTLSKLAARLGCTIDELLLPAA